MNKELKENIDPDMYEKNWPQLTPEERMDRMAQGMGRTMRLYNELIEERYGREAAFDIAAEVIAASQTEQLQNPQITELLGLEGKSLAFAVGKLNAFIEEVLFPMKGATCLEASEDRVVRTMEHCPIGETCGALECEAMHEGVRRLTERLSDGAYAVSTLSYYPDTHVCSYAIHKKE